MKTRLLIVLVLTVFAVGGALAVLNNTCKTGHHAWCAPDTRHHVAARGD